MDFYFRQLQRTSIVSHGTTNLRRLQNVFFAQLRFQQTCETKCGLIERLTNTFSTTFSCNFFKVCFFASKYLKIAINIPSRMCWVLGCRVAYQQLKSEQNFKKIERLGRKWSVKVFFFFFVVSVNQCEFSRTCVSQFEFVIR